MTAKRRAAKNEPQLVSQFRPRARLLQLLGDQLIGSPRLAIFELVKNAYDSDASHADVTMSHLTGPSPEILVQDDGSGMSLRTIEEVWLVPGHDHRAKQRERGERTPAGRLPLGEKGVGRFAVHKLGNVVELVTRAAGGDEIVLVIDWEKLNESEFLSDAAVSARVRDPQTFVGEGHGTRVGISSLRGKPWSRGEVRRLARQITSISSPFTSRSNDFSVTLTCPDESEWLSDLPDTEQLLELAPWEFTFELVDNRLTWRYEFKGIRNINLAKRSLDGVQDGVLVDPRDLPESDQPPPGRRRRAVTSVVEMQDGIGPVNGRIFVYDRDADVLKRLGFSDSLKSFLDESSGLRVYRDDIRVYNYGEPGDDWLGLDLRRVNSPSKRVSNNIIVGSIDLSLEKSGDLREKTNREGFVENDALARLRALVLGILAVLESERNKDKIAIRRLLSKERLAARDSIERPLAAIRSLARKSGIGDEIDPLLAQAQKSYDEMRSIMLRAGVSNMSLVLVFHEIEQGMRLLERHLRGSGADSSVIDQARNLVSVIDGFGDLLRKNTPADHDLRSVVARAVELNSVRLENHGIEVRLSPDGGSDRPANVHIPLGLVLGAITNLIDNSIYWMEARWPSHRNDGERALLIGIDDTSFDEGVALIVADNGPGFVDDFSDVIEPFFTRRPDGMGVGLYYVNLIMHTLGGELRMLARGDVRIPKKYDGAALALIFPRR